MNLSSSLAPQHLRTINSVAHRHSLPAPPIQGASPNQAIKMIAGPIARAKSAIFKVLQI
jgi:hypothetical protein